MVTHRVLERVEARLRQRRDALTTNDHAETERHAIDAALLRIRRGSYGCCIRCGGAIEEIRLSKLPETPFCLSCALAQS